VPDTGAFHPQVVHFVVALLFVGMALRLISLTGRLVFTGPAATVLLVLGTLAAVGAVKSGTDAHGPAERVPGARDAVVEHEEWGERARNIFLAVAALELVALGLAVRRPRAARVFRMGSAAIGLVGLIVLYEAAEHGGDLVYKYAGGVGIRSGDTADVRRLLVAGLYHSVAADRAQGRREDAARLVTELVRRLPDDLGVKLLGVESLLEDGKDARAALAALDSLRVPADTARYVIRAGMLRADAYVAAGVPDSARLTLEALARQFRDNQRITERLARLR
jgi:uncharacterized membrane protein